MDQGNPDRHWDLTAPESLVLLMGPNISDTWALETGLLELVARGYLDIADARWAFLVRKLGFTPHSLVRPSPPTLTGRQCLDTLLLFVPAGKRGVAVKTVAAGILGRQVTWGRHRGNWRKRLTGCGYVFYDVLPDLERRGLYFYSPDAEPGRPATWQWALTPAGLDALAELRDMVEAGKGQFQEWSGSDPARATAYLERANSSVFLIRRIVPFLTRIDGAMAGGDTGTATSARVWPLSASVPLAALLQTWTTGDLDHTFNAIASDVGAAWSEVLRGATTRGSGE